MDIPPKEVTIHANDLIIKVMAQAFGAKTLKIFGLDTARAASVVPTVVPVVEARENRTDLG